MQPRITLVGAGPGDPDLITVKGIKALTDADVVLYDALVDECLLDWAPARAEKVFVGKRKGFCAMKQEEINALIVEMAWKHGHVVRLKGGDPFVFGRGHEEMDFAQAFGMPVAVVPGISSTISVPELQGIPLTRRGISEGFWVVTATTKNHSLSEDVRKVAESTATAVILMGMSKLGEITKVFAEAGKKDTPVAIIQNGSRPDERIGLGTISTIESVVAEEGLSNPAVIVIGEVVRVHPKWAEVREEVAAA